MVTRWVRASQANVDGGHTLMGEASPAIMSRSGPEPNWRYAIVIVPTGTVEMGPRNATEPVSRVPASSCGTGRLVGVLVAGTVGPVVADFASVAGPDEQPTAIHIMDSPRSTARLDRMRIDAVSVRCA